jgi:integrase/recombinase XerD
MGRPVSRVSRVLMAGPLAPFADAYGLELKKRDYTALTSVNQLRQVARLSRWVEASGLTVGELSSERIDEFLVVQRVGGRHRAGWSRPGLVCLLEVLSGLGVLQPARTARVGSPSEVCPDLGQFSAHAGRSTSASGGGCLGVRGS